MLCLLCTCRYLCQARVSACKESIVQEKEGLENMRKKYC
uniref:Uncharacterized protein n=1 Tax=Rhizophora mucronata TaxID=61149 RepID=A0A2P2QJN5_RHIMU